MLEALQEEKVIGKIKELGYEPGVYIYVVTQPPVSFAKSFLFGILYAVTLQPKPYVLNFTEKGIAFIELDSSCKNYTDMHKFISVDQIAEISFNKAIIGNKLILKKEGDKRKQIIRVANKTYGVNWQEPNVKKLEDFIKVYKK